MNDNLDPDVSIDLEPTPADDNSPTTANANAQQRQITERLNDMALLADVLPDLRFNTLTNKIEYGSRTNPNVMSGDDLDLMTTRLAVKKNVYIPEARIRAAIRFAAKENSYCPIKRYLLECSFSAQPYEHWDNLGQVLIGNDMPLATSALQRFLVGAVARAFKPSCNMSWVPIFIGKQGCGKSQLIRELIPNDLFAEITCGLDLLIKEPYRLHVAWILELPEIDNYFSQRNIENFKNLITTRVDETRLPYQSLPVSLERKFVMAGTSNRSEFLIDPTGNRRFIPLEIGEQHETPWRELPQIRDSIWKSAMQAYEAGMSWEITTGELAQMHDYIQSFSVTDPWESLVTQYVSSLEETTTTEVLIHGLKFTPQACGRRESNRVSAILTSMGWRRQVTTRTDPVSKKRSSVRLWRRPKSDPAGPKSLDDF